MKDKFYGNTNEVISFFTARETILEGVVYKKDTIYQSRYGYITFYQWREGNNTAFGLYYIHNGLKYRHIEHRKTKRYYSLSHMITLAKRFAKDVIDGYWDEDK